ncbi:hypothetical protein ABZ532_15625 [Streptomyces sp. NPDC019396]|uniref:hypothetical protein n=1 Tax=Streptomyces sp. NPDC019396 TaxID=3154687 RepID=UPI0033D6E212
MVASQRVAALQWKWAVGGAVVAAVTAAALGMWLVLELDTRSGRELVWWYAATGGMAAIPLVMRDHPKACARACYVVGAGLMAWSVLLAMFLMLWFLPAALFLLIAAFVDTGNRPGARFAVLTPLAAIAALTAMTYL